jgi:Fe-S cluster assembly protein SufD
MLQRLDKPNAAETALIAAAGRLPPTPARQAAIGRFAQTGLPTRKNEDWHYTDLRARLRFAGEPVSAIAAKSAPLVAGHAIRMVGGKPDAPKDLPKEVTVSPAKFDNVGIVPTLAAMFGDGGISLAVEAGAQLAKPLVVQYEPGGASAWASGIAIVAGAGATATVIEHSGGDAPFSVLHSRLVVGDGAKVVWAILQECDAAATELSRLDVDLGADADLTILVLNRGGALVRREIAIAASGANSKLAIRGVNLVGAGSHVDVTTDLEHVAPHVTASEIFRNVVTGDGHGAFQGRIRVAAPAQKTDARMACNTLLLSDEAEFSAKPELEIFADDVQCGHGATVADILPEHLFYLRARGIPEREARAMLVKGFVEDTFGEVANDELREALIARIENWLDRHG